ncbi:DNA cytosine methyltransferase, partial [Clostridia bacterium OttesenSCG-928-O13]|nr:DNA cytosine methyltransferase [Clostridia bacterium OttesenSCG-928-O13]
FVPEPEAPAVDEQALRDTLAARLEQNYAETMNDYRSDISAVQLSTKDFVELADRISIVSTASNASARNAPLVFECHGQSARYNGPLEAAPTLSAAMGMGGGNTPLVMGEAYGIAATAIGRQPHNGGNGLGINKDVSPTLTATDRHAVGGSLGGDVHPEVSGTLCASGAGLSRPAGMASETDLCVAYSLQGNMLGRSDGNGPEGAGINENVSYTLNTRDQHGVAAVDCRNLRETEELSGTLQAKEPGGYSLNTQNPVRTGYIVRRLTPTECERLQGFPDGWTALDEHGKPISDSKRYQMLGNSVAVPCVAYILQGMARHLRKED